MAPHSRSNLHHSDARQHAQQTAADDGAASTGKELFLEPMMGTPLAIYIEKDVQDRDALVELVTKHGGTISQGYSGVPYILVDPQKESGQSLYLQYTNKKGKIILDARWVRECIRAGELQTYHTNWAGCKVTGTEMSAPASANATAAPATMQPTTTRQRRQHQSRTAQQQQQQQVQQQQQAQQAPPQPQPTPSASAGFMHSATPAPPMSAHQTPIVPSATGMAAPAPSPVPPPQTFSYVYQNAGQQQPRSMHSTTSAPPQTWQAQNGISPHQTHLAHPQMMPRPYGADDRWNGQFPPITAPDGTPTLPAMNDAQPPGYYDPRYRDGQQGWPDSAQAYYENQPYDPSYQQQGISYPPAPVPGPSMEPQPTEPVPTHEKPRGRKRTRTQPTPAPAASTLVLNRRHPPTRSPTPPTRVIKSTYGGNLFTADDVLYLKKYIDYCQEQGLVLSLREICERIAVKAPHHTFYSWRRYCNKHQIRLGGYAMDVESRSQSPIHADESMDITPGTAAPNGVGLGTVADAQRIIQERGMRNRSPTPPRALFRSTTGKGVAFTEEDVTFLVKFLAYRKAQGRLDMVAFWKDVATKAPHHSRASWMKFYRRHKHELNRVDGDEPPPAPPAKKMRYGRNDDILLAQYFAGKPEGTSDKIFQSFAKIYPHHPWKGWQEHHRIHKAKIDQLIQRMHAGEHIEPVDEDM